MACDANKVAEALREEGTFFAATCDANKVAVMATRTDPCRISRRNESVNVNE
jgi:hypothetical protein